MYYEAIILSAKRDARAAKRFFRKMLKVASHSSPRVVNVDKNQAYSSAVEQLKEEGTLPERTQLRQCKYLNNILELQHNRYNRFWTTSKAAALALFA